MISHVEAYVRIYYNQEKYINDSNMVEWGRKQRSCFIRFLLFNFSLTNIIFAEEHPSSRELSRAADRAESSNIYSLIVQADRITMGRKLV